MPIILVDAQGNSNKYNKLMLLVVDRKSCGFFEEKKKRFGGAILVGRIVLIYLVQKFYQKFSKESD